MVGRREGRPRRTWPQRGLISFNVVVIVATLATAFALAYANDKLSQIERVTFGGGVLEEEPEDPGEPRNYLVVGIDSAARLDPDDPAYRVDEGVLSDTIMVLRVDPDQTQAQLLSFPRDLQVNIPNWGEAKINAALSAGRDSLIATINQTFGIPINHYVEVDLLGFQELVEAIDGVPVYFDRALRDTQNGFFVGHPGCVVLDPDRALQYVRARRLDYRIGTEWHDDGTSDLGRISRQQDFIRRAIQRAIDKGIRNPITLNALVNAGVGSVTIDDTLTVDDLLRVGRRFSSFDPEELNTMALDTYFEQEGTILRMVDNEANQRRLNIFRGVTEPGVEAEVADAASVAVQTLNGTGAAGQATEVAGALATLGFDTSPGTGDAPTTGLAQTSVRYVAGAEADARFVAAQLPGGALVQEVPDTGLADVVVVTGADFAGVSPTLVPPPTTAPPSDDPPSTTTTTTLPELPPTTVQGIVPQTPEGESCG